MTGRDSGMAFRFDARLAARFSIQVTVAIGDGRKKP